MNEEKRVERSPESDAAETAGYDHRHKSYQETPHREKPYREQSEGRLTVMVVDDSKTIRRNAESLLSREGYSVITAVDGFDAIAKVVEYRPDIVFVDITMPRLDGYQTCALIKNNDAYSDIPVIMLSSRDSIFDKAKGRIVGAGYYLTKPFTREDILGAIRRHVLTHVPTATQPLPAHSE